MKNPAKESAPILKFDNGHGVGIPVQKEWMFSLSWKEQTVLLTSLRGPDGLASEGIRDIVRWIRYMVLNDADSSSGYMIPKMRDNWRMGVDLGPPHFIEHLVICLKVIERRHPDEGARRHAEFMRATVKTAFKTNIEDLETTG